ncbi:hypothetical protein BH587_00695 [Pseudomonas aeruginosa]|nr:hypothetical protein G039_0332735 [Pseudomonas aeruginosa VRFPA01]KFF32768.1 hypothetical protein G039_0328015 [Pseudomonas aeruginosa VRFPA01]OKR01899.1 hypothetical protein BH587_00695 [Pseudomonas aeruginosa]
MLADKPRQNSGLSVQSITRHGDRLVAENRKPHPDPRRDRLQGQGEVTLHHSTLEVVGDQRMVWREFGDGGFDLVATLYRRTTDQATDSFCSCLEAGCLRHDGVLIS